MEDEKGVTQRIEEALRRHEAQKHGAGAIRSWMLSNLVLKSYTGATRPSAVELGAGAVIYNATDSGPNVSDGTNWRAPSGGWVVT